ncbi:pachytene checkpoint 2 protein [Arctopsyche grandis]|uniref:pachytene checkpoint 2 protein n=1 Tax=Arctopsyche grandis TaxID=121162 RepID=UPI00406D7819
MDFVSTNGFHHTMEKSLKPSLYLEVLQKSTSNAPEKQVVSSTLDLLNRFGSVDIGRTFIHRDLLPNDLLHTHVDKITVCDDEDSEHKATVLLKDVQIHVRVYRLLEGGSGDDELLTNGEDQMELQVPAATRTRLPAKELSGLWDSLIFDTSVKLNTLNLVQSSLLFADRKVDPNLLAINRVILLHGPPGTGKTSLCRALAQKLSIRLNDRYLRAQLVEINSHSLFSKWFSESGKLVFKLFSKIHEYVEDSDCFVCVLIDEIESLAHARKVALSGLEPSDSIRTVNAILTQLDKLKSFPNVLVLTTSNLTGAIDIAFVDRADIKQYVGLPSVAAIYKIYHSFITELMRVDIITPTEHLFTYNMLAMCKFEDNISTTSSLKLLDLAKSSVGLSGRTLRKIPFLAHALHVRRQTIDFGSFLKAMSLTIANSLADSETFCQDLKNVKLE